MRSGHLQGNWGQVAIFLGDSLSPSVHASRLCAQAQALFNGRCLKLDDDHTADEAMMKTQCSATLLNSYFPMPNSIVRVSTAPVGWSWRFFSLIALPWY